MKVKELKKILAKCDGNMPVMFNGEGYCWDVDAEDIVVDTDTPDLMDEDDKHIDPPVLLIRL